ncbi:unnamed protein product, partial [Medioppia subpectinata]
MQLFIISPILILFLASNDINCITTGIITVQKGLTPTKLNITLWVLSVTLNLCITFLTWPWLLGNSYHNTASVLYGATHRTLWALSWSYILFACATGHGSIVNTVLSWKALVPLSRLSFQAYLYHSVLISRFVYDARQPLYSSKVTLAYIYEMMKM